MTTFFSLLSIALNKQTKKIVTLPSAWASIQDTYMQTLSLSLSLSVNVHVCVRAHTCLCVCTCKENCVWMFD